MNGQGIDVILAMSWMKMQRAVLDSLVYGKVILHHPAISHIKASLHHMVELKLEDIHVV
jgi:hypothetical protein